MSIVISSANASVSVGTLQQFAAIGTFSDTSTEDITFNTHWSSSAANVATIANGPGAAGLATTAGIGITAVGANSHGLQAATSLTAH